jgi:hypothetical protein
MDDRKELLAHIRAAQEIALRLREGMVAYLLESAKTELEGPGPRPGISSRASIVPRVKPKP